MTESTRGQFLVAAAHLRDPNFYKTVVLMVEHNDDGAMGLVVNRPSNVTVAHALAGHFEVEDATGLVYVGGPVEPRSLFVIHDAADLDERESAVVPGLFVGSSETEFEAIVQRFAAGDDGLRYRIFSGCSGWGPGQLEGELARGDWRLLPATAADAFLLDAYSMWDDLTRRVHERHRILPHAVANPEWN